MIKKQKLLQTLFVLNLIVAVSSGPATGREAGLARQATERAGAAGAATICALSGKVVDFDTGEPVPYFHLLHMKGSGALVEHLETDVQGRFHTTAPKGSRRRFRLDRSRRGTYIVDWDRQRQIDSQPFRGVVSDDMNDLVFKVSLWPVGKLAGKLVDPSGRAVSNASVYIHCDVPAVRTDTEGVFELQAAPTGRDFDLFARSEDMTQAALAHLKAGATAATIHLEPTVTYRGRVVDTEGRAVGPFKLILGLRLNGSDSDCVQEQIQADADGAFTLDYLHPAASYHVWWYPDEQINHTIGQYGSKTVDLTECKPGEVIEIVVEQYLNTLSGRTVNSKGEPVKGAKVMVLTRHGIQAQHRRYKAVYSDDGGQFRLANLADGEVLFNVYSKQYKSRQVWAPTDSADLDIVLRNRSDDSLCQVWVVNDENRPMPDATVNLDFVLYESGKTIASHVATTDTAGKAEFEIVPFDDDVGATGVIRCDLNGYDLAYNSVSDEGDSHVKLVLHRTGEHWAGKIVGPEQNPVCGAKLYMTSMNQWIRTRQRTTTQPLNQSGFPDMSGLTLLAETDTKGEFVLRRFNKKDFVRVIVQAAGLRRREIDLSPERDPGEVFQLSGGAAVVKGIVMNESSRRPVPRASIVLRASNKPERDVVTDDDGTFVVDDLEPGEYVSVLTALEGGSNKGLVCAAATFVAEPDKTTNVTLNLQEGVSIRGRLIESETQERPTARRVYLEAHLESGPRVASSGVDEDASWQLLLPAGQHNLYYSVFLEKIRRFHRSERPLSITFDKSKAYENLVLEMDSRGGLSIQPSSLVGAALPGLGSLGIDLLPLDTRDKRILVCFWDMNQRPSRNCIEQLNERAEQLEAKDVLVAAVQAFKVDRASLDKWVQKNKIALPVAAVRGDEGDRVRFTWGVKSLPWMILADRNHRVIAEGFGLNELGDKLEEINHVER